MITVLDGGRPHGFSYEQMEKYHGPLAPGGIAFACKLMALAFPVFSPHQPIERRELSLQTSFPGLGVRDAFELVTRAVTRDAYHLKPDLAETHAAHGYLAGFVFRLSYKGDDMTLILREGIMRQVFMEMVAKGGARSADEEIQFMWLKEDLGRRVMALHETAVFETLETEEGQ